MFLRIHRSDLQADMITGNVIEQPLLPSNITTFVNDHNAAVVEWYGKFNVVIYCNKIYSLFILSVRIQLLQTIFTRFYNGLIQFL